MTEPVILAARLDLSAAQHLAKALLARRGEDLVLDASAVSHLGAICLQIFLSAALSWSAQGKSLRLAAPSAAVVEALSLSGLALAAIQSEPSV